MLPTVVDSLDTIPEAARGAYVPDGAKFRLDAEFEDTTGLKSKNAELLNKNKALAARAALLGDRAPEDVQADLDYAAEQRKLDAEKKGRYDDIIKQQAEKSAQAIALKDKELAARDAEVYDLIGRQAAIEAISGAGGKVKKLLDPVLKNVKVIRGEDGKAVAVVVDGKGNPRIQDAAGTPMTIAQLVETFKADEDYGNDFAAPNVGGSGARNETGSRVTAGAVVISKDDARDVQKYRAAKARAEKAGVPLAVAG